MSFWKRLFGGKGKSTLATPVSPQPSNPDAKIHSTNALGIELIRVPDGDFVHSFGAGQERKHLPAYEIMKYPVTVAQYRQFSDETGQPMPDPPEWGWVDDHPMVNVTWHDAMGFATWAGLALPTAEEWEKAARGTDGRRYPWGNSWDFSKCRNSVGRQAGGTSGVGGHPAGASPYGVQDMAGNVAEWCETLKGSRNVLSPGNWNSDDSSDFRVDDVGRGMDPSYKNGLIGFRCVLRSSKPKTSLAAALPPPPAKSVAPTPINAPKPSQAPPPASDGYAVISGTSENMEPITKATGSLQTLQYEGGPVEAFYERMSKDLIARHGPLVGVDYVSHWPKFEIWFRYKDGGTIYSGQRTGDYDIHFLTLGYVGQGPRNAHHFFAAAGLEITSEQIASIRPGDSIELRDGKTVLVREREKVVETQEVVFDHEEKRMSFGLPATYRYYKGPSEAAAMAFLEKQNVTARSFFISVETPEGTFCKDCDGVWALE